MLTMPRRRVASQANARRVPTGRRATYYGSEFGSVTDSAVIEQLSRIKWLADAQTFIDRRVLDLGCGTGYTANYIMKFAKCSFVDAIDVDQPLIDENAARPHFPGVSYHWYDGESLPFNNDSYEVVLCCEVLEHLTTAAQRNLVSEAARVLAADGRAIFSTPNRPVYSPGGSSLNPDHINELDQDEFRNLLLQHFSTVTIFGQGYKAEGMFEQRQRHQILSSGLAGRMLKRLGARQLLRRYRARFSNTKPFSDAYHEYRFALPLRDDSFVQIAICDGPRHFHIGCGKHKTQKN